MTPIRDGELGKSRITASIFWGGGYTHLQSCPPFQGTQTTGWDTGDIFFYFVGK